MLTRRWLTSLALVLGASAPTLAQDPSAPPAEGYAETPPELEPYHGVPGVHHRFFREPRPYRGPGRSLPVPEDLSTLRIGLMAPTEGTGEVAIGRALERGVRLALEEANARGGWRGRVPYELVTRNDAAVWGAASNTVVELSHVEHCWAMIGSVDAASTHVALRAALKVELPIVNTACTDPTLTETGIPWLLRDYPDDRQHGYRLAQLAFEELGLRRVAVLRSNDKYGRMGVKEFADAARRLGHPIVLEMRYLPGERDLSTQLDRIQALETDGIVLWGDSTDLGRAVAALRARGMRQTVLGPERLVSPDFTAAAGPAAEGVLATTPLDPARDDPAWNAFRERLRQRFQVEADAFAAFAYDGACILLEAIERAGPSRAGIRDQLAELRSHEGVSGPMRFDPTHNNLGRLYVVVCRDGRFVQR